MATRILIAVLFPLLAVAQSVTGIVSGYVFDAGARAIRPVNGLPGAASLGDPLNFGLPAAFDRVEFTGQDLAYAKTGDQYYRLHLSTSTAELVPGTLSGGRLAAAGLIWYSATQQLQFMSDGSQVFVGATGRLTASALNPVSGCALLAFDSGSIESVCGVNQTQLFQDSSAQIAALTFTSTATFALDVANNRIIEMTTGSAPAVIASGITKPVGLAAVNDSLLAVADAGTRQLSFVALDGSNSPSPVALLFAPTELRNLNRNILRLGKAGSAPFEVVDFNQNNRNFFVPAIAPTSTAAANSAKGAN